MHDARVVSNDERIEAIEQAARRFPKRPRQMGARAVKPPTTRPFLRENVLRIGFQTFIDREDVRMWELAGGDGGMREFLKRGARANEARAKSFEGDGALAREVLGAIRVPTRAFADELFDIVRAVESLPREESHGGCGIV